MKNNIICRSGGHHGAVTLEYVVMITGVISVLIAVLQPTGLFSKSYETVIVTIANEMQRDFILPLEEAFVPEGEEVVVAAIGDPITERTGRRTFVPEGEGNVATPMEAIEPPPAKWEDLINNYICKQDPSACIAGEELQFYDYGDLIYFYNLTGWEMFHPEKHPKQPASGYYSDSSNTGGPRIW